MALPTPEQLEQVRRRLGHLTINDIGALIGLLFWGGDMPDPSTLDSVRATLGRLDVNDIGALIALLIDRLSSEEGGDIEALIDSKLEPYYQAKPPTMQINDGGFNFNGNPTTVPLAIYLFGSPPSDRPIQVDYEFSPSNPGTITTPLTGTIVVPAYTGIFNFDITVTAITDVTVTLSNPINATFSDDAPTITATIQINIF